MRTRIDERELTDGARVRRGCRAALLTERGYTITRIFLVVAVRTIEEQYDDGPQIPCDLILSTFGDSTIRQSQ